MGEASNYGCRFCKANVPGSTRLCPNYSGDWDAGRHSQTTWKVTGEAEWCRIGRPVRSYEKLAQWPVDVTKGYLKANDLDKVAALLSLLQNGSGGYFVQTPASINRLEIKKISLNRVKPL